MNFELAQAKLAMGICEDTAGWKGSARAYTTDEISSRTQR